MRAQRGRRIREIPLEAICGTLEPSRATLFDRCFRPAASARRRWERLWVAEQRGAVLPPISVVAVGELYAIRDGHHRVSVARARGAVAEDQRGRLLARHDVLGHRGEAHAGGDGGLGGAVLVAVEPQHEVQARRHAADPRGGQVLVQGGHERVAPPPVLGAGAPQVAVVLAALEEPRQRELVERRRPEVAAPARVGDRLPEARRAAPPSRAAAPGLSVLDTEPQ